MAIISSKSDIISHITGSFGDCTDEEEALIAEWMHEHDARPAYGSDWSEWLASVWGDAVAVVCD